MFSLTPSHTPRLRFQGFPEPRPAQLLATIGFLLLVVLLAACSRPGPVRETPISTPPATV